MGRLLSRVLGAAGGHADQPARKMRSARRTNGGARPGSIVAWRPWSKQGTMTRPRSGPCQVARQHQADQGRLRRRARAVHVRTSRRLAEDQRRKWPPPKPPMCMPPPAMPPWKLPAKPWPMKGCPAKPGWRTKPWLIIGRPTEPWPMKGCPAKPGWPTKRRPTKPRLHGASIDEKAMVEAVTEVTMAEKERAAEARSRAAIKAVVIAGDRVAPIVVTAGIIRVVILRRCGRRAERHGQRAGGECVSEHGNLPFRTAG